MACYISGRETDIQYITPYSTKQAVDPITEALYIFSIQVLGKLNAGHYGEKQLDIKNLEDRVDELISTVERLRSENKTLRESQTNLVSERDKLIQKTEQARTRVETMIQRLKAMEDE